MEIPEGAGEAPATTPPSPSTEQRARAERNRLRARALRDARRAASGGAAGPSRAAAGSGGGFLPEEAAPPAAARAAPPAPEPDPAARRACTECGRPVASSHLLDAFDHPACDGCRDDGGAHALLTRTEAKAEYLLRDADLDERWGALRCVLRRNPHAARGRMRLYLRAQVEQRALLVWGSAERLRAEREARAARRDVGRARAGARRLRALRAELRPPARARSPHRHEYGAEVALGAPAGLYARACACGHRQTYEKM